MKKILLLIVSVMTVATIQAVPAHPKPVKVQQPDGTCVTIKLHGDEWLNFTATEDGYSVVKDSRGYYVYAELKDQQLQPTAQIAHDAVQRSAAERAFLAHVKKYQAPAMRADMAKMKEQVQQIQRRALASRRTTNMKNFRGLVILVQFNDREFSRPDYKDIITDLLNKEGFPGYDDQVYSGSVRDYFADNSKGKFVPQFDVVGPVTVDFSQYDPKQTDNVEPIIKAALDAVDDEVDFSQYDGDGNKVVDMVYFMIAGKGSHYGGNDENLWWPHRSQIIYNNDYVYKDGVRLWDYASSVELSDNSDTLLDGIGVICHEFGHVLGLPDFYDTDYEGSGGLSIHPGNWSVMSSGNYHNNARTPAGYSLYERYLVGFIDDIPLIDEENSFTLEPLYVNQKGYRINSPVDNEFFLLENRQNDGSYKWDKYLPAHGLLAYRVDRTDIRVWDTNKVNVAPAHNYYEILWAGGSGQANKSSDTYPGSGNVTELNNLTTPANLLTHDGSKNILGLFNIREEGGNILFDVASGGGAVKPYHVAASNITASSADITWTGANDNYNVQYRTAVVESVLFFDDFEKGLSDWTIIRNADGTEKTDWQTVRSASYFRNLKIPAHSGNYVAMSRSWAVDAFDVDNWLITPQVTLDGTLRFWVTDNGSQHEHYDVYVSTTTNDITAFTKIYEPGDASDKWTEISIDLSSYAGQKGYIAIRHQDSDKDYLFIDDFGIYGVAKAAGDWQTQSTTQPSVLLTGLAPETAYEVQVQAETTSETSDWSAPILFTTLSDGTKVEGITVAFDDGQYYNLKGQKMSTPTEKGVYIQNGKKVVIK